MMTVKKANVFLDIEDEDLQKYLNLGYCQVDPKTGAILVACIPTDVGELQVAYAQHTKKIAEPSPLFVTPIRSRSCQIT